MIFYYYLLLMLIIKHIIISINLIDSSSYHYCNQRRTFLIINSLNIYIHGLSNLECFHFETTLLVIRKHWNLATFLINTKHFILLTFFTYLFTTYFHFNADTKLCGIIIIQRYASNFRFCNIIKWMKV